MAYWLRPPGSRVALKAAARASIGPSTARRSMLEPFENKPHRASSSARAHLDKLLDEALEQTFPASDAVAIDIELNHTTVRHKFSIPETLLAGGRKVGQRTTQKH